MLAEVDVIGKQNLYDNLVNLQQYNKLLILNA